jgi:hypothetical protein
MLQRLDDNVLTAIFPASFPVFFGGVILPVRMARCLLVLDSQYRNQPKSVAVARHWIAAGGICALWRRIPGVGYRPAGEGVSVPLAGVWHWRLDTIDGEAICRSTDGDPGVLLRKIDKAIIKALCRPAPPDPQAAWQQSLGLID